MNFTQRRTILTRNMSSAIHKPNKRLGQHFLINRGVLDTIVAAVDLTARDVVVEVGPGKGQLTDLLLATGARVVAVEKDHAFAEYLRERYRATSRITIVEGDILHFDPSAHNLKSDTYKLLGNIPYYLTSHLIRTVLEAWPQPQHIVFMIQKEVADRMMAKPPKMNMLALLVQYHTTPTQIARVSRGSFSPPPKVESAIIKFVPKDVRGTPEKIRHFFAIARAGLAHPRKTLINNLASGLRVARTTAESACTGAGIELKTRPGELPLEQWQKLAELFTEDAV